MCVCTYLHVCTERYLLPVFWSVYLQTLYCAMPSSLSLASRCCSFVWLPFVVLVHTCMVTIETSGYYDIHVLGVLGRPAVWEVAGLVGELLVVTASYSSPSAVYKQL